MNKMAVLTPKEMDGVVNDKAPIGQKECDVTKSEIIDEFGKTEKNTLDQSTIDEIYGDRDKIRRFLGTKCLDVKRGVTEYGEEGDHYYFTFPTVNGFSCKKLDRFVSKRSITKEEFDKNEEWKANSSSVEDLSAKLFELMRDFLKELGVSKDENVDFVKYMFENERCDTGESVVYATDSDLMYWTSSEKGDQRAQWYCYFDYCKFSRFHVSFDTAFLLLGLSVS